MARLLRNFFCLILFCSSLTFRASQIVHTLGKIGSSQPTALVSSFFMFFAAAVPHFAMAAYQFHNNNNIDSEGKSNIVQFLFPFVLRLDKRKNTINPTTFSSKEYFSTGLMLSALSLFYLAVGGILTKFEETFGLASLTDNNVSFGRDALDQFTTGESHLYLMKSDW
jgi:hypothetical protein